MRRLFLMAAFAASAVPAAAQQNPFKAQKAGIKSAQISYTMSGDMSGSASVAFDGERMARRSTSTTKMMGKTTSADTWTLSTPDSVYTADLTKKKGTVTPNMLPYMAKAYDDLDGDAKKRLHQNMEEMASIMSKAFGLAGINGGEKIGSKTYAGQECEEKKFGGFEICTMNKAPIMLHTKASIVCVNYEETATEVKLGSVSGDAFTAPAGVVFTPNEHLTKPDSMALGYVNYLASQELSDSLAKAKAQMAGAGAGPGAPQMTPEQQAAMQKACETMKNLDPSKMIADASNQMLKGMADAAKRAAMDAAKNAAENKVKGIFKKPKIPTW